MGKKDNNGRELFEELYDTHADAVFRFCYFKTGDREIAKDLAQDIFIKVFNFLVKGKLHDGKNTKAFIYTVARNTVVDYWRKKKSVPESELPEGFFESIPEADKMETGIDYGIFLTLLNKLSESDREVIELRFVEDLSSKDMVGILGERENTILVRINRAKEKLRNLLKELENKDKQ